MMPIRRYRRDPRSDTQRRADEAALAAFERGEFLSVEPTIERAAINFVTSRQAERRRLAASLGIRLGWLRRAHCIPQQQLARVLGTSKSNVSRLESGRDGGLTVERLIAIEDAIRSLAGRTAVAAPDAGLIRVEPLGRFRNPGDCLEAAA
jgi:DNA-binding transcriptional regulator YiaG